MKKVLLLFFWLLILNLFFVSSFQESYGNITRVTVNRLEFIETGAVAGEWTHDIEAARALARINKVPMLINFGRTSGCGNCNVAENNIYSKEEFKQWAKQSGFPLVYADYSSCYTADFTLSHRLCSNAVKEVMRLYPWATVFPMLILVDEKDGQSVFGSALAITSFWRGNRYPSGASGFKSLVESMMNGQDNHLIRNLSFYPTNPLYRYSNQLYINSSISTFKLYNQYGDNSLTAKINNPSANLYMVYLDTTDWYNVSGIFAGNKYYFRAINVSDSENIGRVSFYYGLENALNGVSFKEMTLNEFRNGYQFTATNNQNVYIKLWMENPFSYLTIGVGSSNDSLKYTVNFQKSNQEAMLANGWEYMASSARPYWAYSGRKEFNFSYNLEYYQGEGSVGNYSVNSSSNNTNTGLNTQNYSRNTVSRTIYDFINMFSGWFSSLDRLSISHSGAIAGEWTTDYSSAKQLSIENNRPMIVLFGKSLNERHSKDVIKNVLNSPAWKEYSRVKGLSLAMLDFSNKSSLSQEAIKLYPQSSLGKLVKLPTFMYLDSNQELLGVCVYRKGLVCDGKRVESNVTNFVQILESYTGEILDLENY